MKRQYLIIAADFWADIGNRFVSLTLLDLLVFKSGSCLPNLLRLSVVEQAPSIFLGPFAGLLVDRIGPVRLLAGILMYKCALVAILAFTILPEAVISIYLFFICASIFFTISRLAIIPLLVPGNRLIPFNALNEAVAIAGAITSPFIVGWTISHIGKGGALGMAGFLFLVAIFAVGTLSKNVAPLECENIPDPSTQDRRNCFSGYRVIFNDNDNLRTCFILFGFVIWVGGILNFSLPLLFKNRIGGNIAQWGFIISLFQAGSFLATLLLPRLLFAVRQKVIMSISSIALAAAMLIILLATNYIQAALAAALFGCGFTMHHIFWESLIQKNSSKAYMGKIFGLLSSFRGALYLMAAVISAIILSILGVQYLFGLGSLAIGAAAFLTLRIRTALF